MSNVDYQFIFRKVQKELDDEITKWYEYYQQAESIQDYLQMIGIAQGVEKAQKILAQYIEDGVGK